MVERGMNGIQLYRDGTCTLRLRFIGCQTYIVAHRLANVLSAKSFRGLTIARSRLQPSAVGITKLGNQYKAATKHRGVTYTLGHFIRETDAADCRLAFDAWAEYQPEEVIFNELIKHRTRMLNL